MIFPNNGKVVIIDDKYDEVKALMATLSSNKIPFTYFQDETGKDLPTSPIKNVRLVFLDLVLFMDQDQMPPKAIVSSALSRLIKIIGENNGPYFLFVWSTKYENYSDLLKLEFEKDYFATRKPVGIIALKKIELIGATIEKINTEIEAAIKNHDALKAFFFWESIINDSSGDHTNDIASIVDKNYWNLETKNLIHKLSFSYWGKYLNELSKDPKSIMLGAFYTINQTFNDRIDSNLETAYDISLNGIAIKGDKSNTNSFARINEQLHIANYSLNHNMPGCVYFPIIFTREKINNLKTILVKKEQMIRLHKPRGEKTIELSKAKETYKKDEKIFKNLIIEKNDIFFPLLNDSLNTKYFKRRKSLYKECIYLELNVSPICDHAQQKLKFTRILPGALIPASKHSWFNKNAHYNYLSDFYFNYKGNEYYFLFDHRFLFSSDPKSIKYETVFRVKDKLLNDIQIKLSGHINRIGLSYMY